MERIRVLIVDDEPPARSKLRRFLAGEPEVEVVGEAESGADAVAAIEALRPDLVFLDVQMPGLDGFGVLAELAGEALPGVVFVTAFDEYALRAFEVNAVDYVLKPFDAERFRSALARAKERLRQAGAAELDRRLRAVLAQVRPPPEYLERLLVRSGERAFFLELSEVSWIAAEQNYVRLHAAGTSHLVRGTLAALEERLDPRRFLRIHRSTIVNAAHVRELRPWSHGDYRVVLRDGTELTLSRRYRDRLPEAAV
jgi:two-component system, LytTR family, response regulator